MPYIAFYHRLGLTDPNSLTKLTDLRTYEFEKTAVRLDNIQEVGYDITAVGAWATKNIKMIRVIQISIALHQ